MTMVAKRYNVGEKEARAFLRQIKGSAQKLNLVAQSIRRMPVAKALDHLAFSKKRTAADVKKLLMSAVANAQNNYGLDVDKLVVKEAFVGKAVTLKRFHARARGRGAAILKPFSNMTIIVAEMAPPASRAAAPSGPAAAGKPAKTGKPAKAVNPAGPAKKETRKEAK
jgi:large subunit ribosomal protein L22